MGFNILSYYFSQYQFFKTLFIRNGNNLFPLFLLRLTLEFTCSALAESGATICYVIPFSLSSIFFRFSTSSSMCFLALETPRSTLFLAKSLGNSGSRRCTVDVKTHLTSLGSMEKVFLGAYLLRNRETGTNSILLFGTTFVITNVSL